jgi:hypothetical protein
MPYERLDVAVHAQDGPPPCRQSIDESWAGILEWTLKLRLVPFFFCLFANFVVTSFFAIGWAQEHGGDISKEQAEGLRNFCVIMWAVWTVLFVVCYSFPRPWRQVRSCAT